ncbi:hypothetical protein [Thermosediminibacter litoriperuensis]|uniref:DUF8052 domain-containing protein n=1 Tax=Thermosediminibacter litoriperuensis TaxID=291989 RepID=A0A5S5AH19_9FIRM|nr:hypothetical protein [Thermosediminibacter litoriperuensis]TYP49766.1 hypothetical protein LZ11_02140 [Thermosediminibacter litoriperuensis]
MDSGKYLEMLSERLKPYFDLEREIIICGKKTDLFARCHVKHVRTFLTPKDVIDSYETNEYFVVKIFDGKLKEEDLFLFDTFLKDIMKIYVSPGDGHMCSIINGVMVLEEGLDGEVEKKVRNYSYEKSYFFSLKGWSRINLAVVDLKSGRIIPSRRGKKLEQLLMP